MEGMINNKVLVKDNVRRYGQFGGIVIKYEEDPAQKRVLVKVSEKTGTLSSKELKDRAKDAFKGKGDISLLEAGVSLEVEVV